MGKKFGLLSIIFGIAPESYYFILIFIIFIIILGGIGIFKDESRGSGIGGVVLGVVAVVLWIVFPIIFSS
jgi:hypothetical protein